MFTYVIDDELSLYLLQPHDYEELFQLVNRNRMHLREWMPWVDTIQFPLQYLDYIKLWMQQLAENNGFQVGILYKNQLAGMIAFHHIDWSNRATAMGYWVGKEFEGKGIVTRAVEALCHIAFVTWELERVEVRVAVNNKRSQRIPEQTGFVYEGTLRNGEFLYDHYHDLKVYSMIKKDFFQDKKERGLSTE